MLRRKMKLINVAKTKGQEEDCKRWRGKIDKFEELVRKEPGNYNTNYQNSKQKHQHKHSKPLILLV